MRDERASLWTLLSRAAPLADRRLTDARTEVRLGDLAGRTSLGGRLDRLTGRSVLVATTDQLTAALALIELDGVARRLVVCPPDLPAAHAVSVMATAEVDAVVSDRRAPELTSASVPTCVPCRAALGASAARGDARQATDWVLLTSGTSGVPKLVLHTLGSLTAPIT